MLKMLSLYKYPILFGVQDSDDILTNILQMQLAFFTGN